MSRGGKGGTNLAYACAEARADLIEHSLDPMHVEFCTAMIQSTKRQGDGLFPHNMNGPGLAHAIKHMAFMAEMFTGTPEMMDAIAYASRSMPPQELLREDLPAPDGFLRLPMPFDVIDIRNTKMPVDAIMWSEREIGRPGENVGPPPHFGRGLVAYAFTETGSAYDPLLKMMTRKEVARIRAEAPVLSLSHAMSVGFGRTTWDVDTAMIEGTEEDKARWARRAMRSMHDVVAYEEIGDGVWSVTTGQGNVVRARPDQLSQFLKAYFAFCASELTSMDREMPPRSVLKHLRRANIDNSPITIIRLRRIHGAGHGEGGMLSYRHVRRGHWRKQWYGSGDKKYQRAIWIAPTLVGDESLPLRARDVVNLAQR
jgi:hypothetical protein